MKNLAVSVMSFLAISGISLASPSLVLRQDGGDVVIRIVKDDASENVNVNLFNDEWIGVKIQLWNAGRGVMLYSPANAKWRRGSAFIDSKWIALSKNKPLEARIRLSASLPGSPLNDAMAKALYDAIPDGDDCEIVIVAEYSDRNDGKGEIHEIYKKMIFKKVAKTER